MDTGINMSQFSSIQEKNLERQLIKIEKDLLSLKAKQFYDPKQINYTYSSDNVSVSSYTIFSTGSNNQGILATFIFSSYFPTIYPRVILQVNYSSSYGILLNTKYERYSQNQCKITAFVVDEVVPLSPAHSFVANFVVRSNVAGTLALEKTYVLPN